MTDATTTDTAADDFIQLKTVFNLCQSKMKRFESPTNELQQICEAVREAVATNRMATDEAFREFVYKELAIGLMQKMAKTNSFDSNVSPTPLIAPLFDSLTFTMLALVRERVRGHDGSLHGHVCLRA